MKGGPVVTTTGHILFQEHAATLGTIPRKRNEFTDSSGFQADQFIVILNRPNRYCSNIDLDEFIANQKNPHLQ